MKNSNIEIRNNLKIQMSQTSRFEFRIYLLHSHSYRRICIGFVFAATIAGINVPTTAAKIAIKTITKAQDQLTLLGISLNIYTLLFHSFNPKIFLIHSSITFTFFVTMYPSKAPIIEPIIPTQNPNATKIQQTEPLAAPQLFTIAMSLCLSRTII